MSRLIIAALSALMVLFTSISGSARAPERRAVFASLWEVEDRASSELMKKFYQGLIGPEHLRPAEALRQAQILIWK